MRPGCNFMLGCQLTTPIKNSKIMVREIQNHPLKIRVRKIRGGGNYASKYGMSSSFHPLSSLTNEFVKTHGMNSVKTYVTGFQP